MARAKEIEEVKGRRKKKERKKQRELVRVTRKSRFNRDSIESLAIDLSRGTRRCFYTPNKLL